MPCTELIKIKQRIVGYIVFIGLHKQELEQNNHIVMLKDLSCAQINSCKLKNEYKRDSIV
jgi:hypothetical protein